MMLTRVESEANGMLMAEHRAQTCNRCRHRQDIDGWELFACRKNLNTGQAIALRRCQKWQLDENQENWVG